MSQASRETIAPKRILRGTATERRIVGQVECGIGKPFRNEFEHGRSDVGQVLAPAIRANDASAIETGESAFVVAAKAAPGVHFLLGFAAVLLRQNPGVQKPDQAERVEISMSFATLGTR